MNKDEYKEFLQSMEWKAVRSAMIKEYPTCIMCYRPAEEVHHIRYIEGIKGYLDKTYLRTVCRNCHREIHLFDKLATDFKNNNAAMQTILANFSEMVDPKPDANYVKSYVTGAYMYKLFRFSPNVYKYTPVFTLLSKPSIVAEIKRYVADALPDYSREFCDLLNEMEEKQKEADNG